MCQSWTLDIPGSMAHAAFSVSVTAVFYLEMERDGETVTVCDSTDPDVIGRCVNYARDSSQSQQ